MKIRTQMAIAVFCAAGVGIGAMVADRYRSSGAILENRAQARADAIAESAAAELLPRLRAGDAGRLRDSVSGFSRLQGVRSLAVLDSAGNSLYATPRHAIDEPLIEAAAAIEEDGRPLGSVRVGITTQSIRSSKARMARRGACVGAAILAVLAGLAWGFGFLFGRKLESLVAAVERLDAADMAALPEFNRDSEAGRLSREFQRLRGRLLSEECRRRELETGREEMTAMLVHDLKHPLTVMKMVLAVLEEHGQGARREGVDRAMRLAKRSVDRLDGMITNILQVARVADPGAVVRRSRLSVSEVMEEAREENAALVERSGYSWSFDIEPRAARRWIHADRALILRVIGNLVMNAVDHSPSGGKIALSASLSSKGFVVIAVHDEGAGVPPEIMGRIFDKFSTFAESTRNVGLGLAFCGLVAKAHGARLDVLERDRAGATFALTLPSLETPRAVGAEKPAPAAGPISAK
jgi:signal transduction histidine kinase